MIMLSWKLMEIMSFNQEGVPIRSGWQSGFNTDITGAFSTAGQHTIKLSVLTGGATHDGGGFLVMNIVKNANDMEQEFLDFPAGCRQRMFDNWPPTVTAPDFISNGSATDDASTKWWKCTEASDSKIIEGVTITPALYGNYFRANFAGCPTESARSHLLRSRNPRTRAYTLPCFTDKDGYQVCPEYDYNNDEHTACDEFTANPQCAYIGKAVLWVG